MAFIAWEDRYLVGVPVIDTQHKKLITITNDLYDACKFDDNAARGQFRLAVQATVEYTKYHFSTEEQIMEKFSYPVFSAHRKEHADFVQEVLTNVQIFEEGKKFVPNSFVRFLRDWILSHIALTDRKLGEFLVQYQMAAQQETTTLKRKDAAGREKRVVLAVDDAKTQLAILKQVLDQYDVYTCASPVYALDILKNMDVDIVLLDLAMEEMSGLEFLRQLKKNRRTASIPVIIVSGNSTETYLTASIRMGAQDFVTKPVNPGILRKKIERLLP
jgi:hemerythrin